MLHTWDIWFSKMGEHPTIELDLDNVKYLLALEYKLEDIATILNVSSSTLHRHMKNAHI